MAKLTKREIERGSWELQEFIGSKQARNPVDVVAVATIALLSLGGKNNEEVSAEISERFFGETEKSLQKYMKYFFEISARGAKLGEAVLKAIIASDDPKILGLDRHYGNCVNPKFFNKLLIELHHLSSDDMYLEYGAGVGNGIMLAADLSKAATGVEINKELVAIADIKTVMLSSKGQVVMGNINDCANEYRADKITVDMPLGMRNDRLDSLSPRDVLFAYSSMLRRSGLASWRHAMAAYFNNPDGRVIAVMEPGALFGQPDSDLRKTIVNQGIIEGVIDMPGNLFYSSAIKVSLVILSKGNKTIKFMDASDMCTVGRRLNTISDEQIKEIVDMYDTCTDKCVSISVGEVAEKGYVLMPTRYTDLDIPEYDGIPLGECASIGRGALLRASELEKLVSHKPTNIQYLMLQHIETGKIATDLPYLSELDKGYERFCISENEIILSKNGPFKVAMANVSPGMKVLANGNLYRIKVDGKIMNPIYVMLFLRSEIGMSVLFSIATTGIMQTISLRDLRQVLIPNIPKKEQDKIAQKYKELCDELNRLDKERAEIINKVNSLVVVDEK